LLDFSSRPHPANSSDSAAKLETMTRDIDQVKSLIIRHLPPGI
jgi:hypothetical protein